jgi:hypothetical protein
MSVYPSPVSVSIASHESKSRIAAGDPATALNLLGRSTDYLLQLRLTSIPVADGDEEAIRILHRLRRKIFEEYARSFQTKDRSTSC